MAKPWFSFWSAPQQMLRTHRSLKAYCEEKDDQFFFSFFQVMEKLIGENRSTWGGRTSSSATLSTTNPTWTVQGSNPVLRGGRPATNRLSHDTALSHNLVRKTFADGNKLRTLWRLDRGQTICRQQGQSHQDVTVVNVTYCHRHDAWRRADGPRLRIISTR
jgi:hypothetical protein